MATTYNKAFLEKYLNGWCTQEEERAFLEWLKHVEENDDAELKAFWEQASTLPSKHLGDEDRIWQKILPHLQESEPLKAKKELHPSRTLPHTIHRKKRQTPYLLRYAAIIVCIITAIVAIRYFLITDEMIPESGAVSQVVRRTEAGEKLTIKLPDGTKVNLNSGSTLTFPSQFSDKERKVELKGEAYFDVEKDPDRPFRVYSNNLMTQALGTSFNIQSFGGSEETVSLASGKVLVSGQQKDSGEVSVMLNPGEELAFNTKKHTYQKQPFNYKERILWKDGVLYFKGDDIDTIIKRLENWYGVQITLRNRTHERWEYTGELDNPTLEVVLEGIAFSKGIRYKIKGKSVDIYMK